MPWFFPWSESIKKRACRYLLQYYLGRFLERKLELDQLSVDLYKGTGSVKNVELDVEALNQVCNEQNLPIEVINGCISEVTVSVPWSNLLNDSSFVEIQGLFLTIHPKHQSKNGFTWESMINSMSMTTSLQLAEECLKQDHDDIDGEAQPSFEGLEMFAKTLETVLARVKVRLLNTTVRLECLPNGSVSGIGLEIHISKIDYFDMAGLEQTGVSGQPTMIERTSYATKKFMMEGVTIYTDEFSMDSESSMPNSSHQEADLFKSTTQSFSDSSSEDAAVNETLILCGKLYGRHELSVHMKISDIVLGPKVELDLIFGSSVFFLSPRQLHSLTFLVDWFMQPTVDGKNRLRIKQSEKPMQPSDYKKIENELLHQLQSSSNTAKAQGEFLSRKGWSSGVLDISCEDEDFHPFSEVSKHSNFRAQTFRSESPEKSVPSGSENEQPLDDVHENSTGLKFNMKVGGIVCVLLHEDILTCNSSAGGRLVESTVAGMKTMAENFLSQTGLLAFSGMGAKGYKTSKEKILKACSRNHLQLILAPVNFSGTQEDYPGGPKFDYHLTAGLAEVAECLTDSTSDVPHKFNSYPVLSFLSGEHESSSIPNIIVKMSSAHPSRLTQARGFNSTKTGHMFHIQLSPCNLELDISIVDRITALLNRPAFLNNNKTKICQMYRDNTKGVDALLNDSSQQQTCINISSSVLNLRIRFPIPDLRPFHDPQRTPWWHRHLRPDVLTLQLHDVSIISNCIPNETVSIYEMQCKKLSCSYRDGREQKEDITFLHAGAQDGDVVDMEEGAGHYDLPRLILTLRPYGDHLEEQETLQNEENILEEELDAMNFASGDATFRPNKSDPSPFAKQRRVRGAEPSGDTDTNSEELLIPGSTEDIAKFISFSSRNCSYQLDVSLPKVEFILPSKQFYESLYNRLSTDLCLWEPSAPMFIPQKNFFEEHQSTTYAGLGAASLHTPSPGFIMCKSGVAYDSDSESESDGNADFQSVCGISEHSKPSKETPSKLCISVMIGQACGTVICDLKDHTGETSKSHRGQLTVSLVNGRLFSVSTFKGDPLLGYVSFCASRAEVYHNGSVTNPAKEFLYQSFQANAEDQVIYPSERFKASGKNCATPMLSVVVEIKTEARLDVKKFKTAIAVENGTLRHRFCPAEQTWLTQIIDFFDVVDDPIAGYKPPKVVTELHSNFVNCGIDYRPLYLPAKVYVSVGALNISSNIVAQTKSSLLRFIVEDLSLHLSNRPSVERIPSIDNDYVCVLEVDVAELSLRIQESLEKSGGAVQKSNSSPTPTRQANIDLEAMVNVFHLRTCADSCRLLLDLITYLADDGDLDETSTTISDDASDCNVVATDCDNSKTNGTCEKQLDAQVCNLMADAMIDSSPTSANKAPSKDSMLESLKCQTEVFFFPDESAIVKRNKAIKQEENTLCKNLQNGVSLNLLNAALSHPSDEGDSSLEEDFCILGNDPGVGIRPRGGEPTIRQLNSIVQIVEGHFSPPFRKSDVLKAPKHFPRPVVRYALRDMTLVWEIYGGQDFSCQEPSSNAKKKQLVKTVTFAKGQDNQASVKIGSHKAEESVFSQLNHNSSKKEYKIRSIKGGIGRLEDVKLELQMNKVRFIHDVYPDSAVQASRQVLSIGEIEIRDRLAQSHINKLLYQYCSEARPRQSHANMVLIKALHVRPDFHGSTQECCLKVSVLPLRLHLDQDTLTFINEFFGSIASCGTYNNGQEVDKVNHFTPVPVMNVATEASGTRPESTEPSPSPDANESSAGQPVYFRSFTFSPDVLIRFDYHGKGVDLSQGPSLSGLLAGLGQLNCSQLTLKRMSNRHGLLGVNRLAAYAINEWIMDIKKNQLPSVMAGVGPMHSIVQLVQGIRDLFWLPIEQFQRDGRIVRGLQRGANAFSTSAAFAILELTSRMIQTLQTAAETAYDVVSPGPSVKRSKPGSRGRRRRHTQPTDIRDGVAKAYQVVKEGLGETAQNLVRVASEEAEQKGMTGAVGGVLRQIPPIVVKPIILATEATVSVIGGVQSQLVPDTRREAIDKWRQDD